MSNEKVGPVNKTPKIAKVTLKTSNIIGGSVSILLDIHREDESDLDWFRNRVYKLVYPPYNWQPPGRDFYPEVGNTPFIGPDANPDEQQDIYRFTIQYAIDHQNRKSNPIMPPDHAIFGNLSTVRLITAPGANFPGGSGWPWEEYSWNNNENISFSFESESGWD
jgi:hypothetical protein